jgi:anti-sigma factor RsiW
VNHSRVQDCLSAYLENDLSPVDRSAVEEHLAACTVCAEDLRDLRQAVALLRRLPTPEPPPFLASRVMARIADGEAEPARWRRWLAQASAPVIAAPLAAAAAALAVFLLAGAPDERATRIAERPPRVPQLTGTPAEPPPVLAARVLGPDLLARQLRGAGHPYSAEFAGHFDGPSEAVAVSWRSR